MKRPQPDIREQLQNRFISTLSTVRKLKKYWSTETRDGVEVMKSLHYYYDYDKRTSGFEKLFRFLGMYDDVVDIKMKGISRAWIYFNKNKAESSLDVSLDVFVADNLNMMWWDYNDGPRPSNLTLTTIIDIEAEQQSNTSASTVIDAPTTSLLDPSWTMAQLATAIEENYDSLWDTCHISQQGVGVINKGSFTDPVTAVVTPDKDDLSPDDPWLQTIARHALRTSGVSCTIKDVEIGYGQLENGRLYPVYSVTIEMPFTEFTPTDPVITNIANELQGTYSSRSRTKMSYPNAYYTKQAIQNLNGTDEDTDADAVVTRKYFSWEEAGSTSYDTLWHRAGGSTFIRTLPGGGTQTYHYGGTWYLRAGIFDSPRAYGLTYKELNDYVLPLIDTDYRKKKSSGWFRKIVAIVVFVIAVIFAPATGGGSLALAKAVLFAVLVMTVIQMALSVVGATEWAMAFAAVNKAIEPLAIIATIVLIWTGITAAIEAAKKAATQAAQAAGKEAAEMTLGEVVMQLADEAIDKVIDKVVTSATELFSGTITANVKLLKSMAKIVDILGQLKLESINDRNKDLQMEYDKLVEEAAQESDVLQGFARVYASPATADWSMFAGLYDLPYERSGGSLHTGNIQRTTVQALRKTTYDDPAFANILVI